MFSIDKLENTSGYGDKADMDTNDNVSIGGVNAIFQNKLLSNFNQEKCLQENSVTVKVCKELSLSMKLFQKIKFFG